MPKVMQNIVLFMEPNNDAVDGLDVVGKGS